MATARAINEAEWNVHKAQITALCPTMTLDDLMVCMEREHGFFPSKNQWVKQVRKWNIRKYPTRAEWETAVPLIRKRKLDGKETEVLFNRRRVDKAALEKALRRYACPGPDAKTGPAALTDDGITVHTPPAQEIDFIDLSKLPWFQFQTLLESSFALPVGNFVIISSSSFGAVTNDSSHAYMNSMSPGMPGEMNRGPVQTTSDVHMFEDLQERQPNKFSPVAQQANRDIQAILGDVLDEPVDPNNPEYISKITSNLEEFTSERQAGDIVRHMLRLCSPSGMEGSFPLLHYVVYLCSNNMLAQRKVDKLPLWILKSGKFWYIEHLLEAKTPSMEIFASCLLVSAARLNDSIVSRAIIEKAIDPNAFAGSRTKDSALQEALRRRNLPLIRNLLDAGANVNSPNDGAFDFYTPSLLVNSPNDGSFEFYTPLLLAITECASTPLIAQALIDHGGDVNSLVQNDTYSTTLLQVVVARGNVALAHMLLKAGARVNEATALHGTPLQTAALRRNIEMVELLLSAGADVNSPEAEALEDICEEAANDLNATLLKTPLQHAAEGDQSEMAQALLDAGAEINGFPGHKYARQLGFDGHTSNCHCNTDDHEDYDRYDQRYNEEYDKEYDASTHCSECIMYLEELRTPLQAASSRNNIVLVRILLSLGADVDATGGTGTALQLAAAKAGSLKLVQLLLNKGSDVNAPAQDPTGWTAVQAAAISGDEALVEHLLNAGANVNALPSCHGGRTALQAAAKKASLSLIKMLVEAGAEINAAAGPVNGRTCLQAAAARGDMQILDYFLENGADVDAPASSQRGERTALQAAIYADRPLVTQRLLENGADANAHPSPLNGRPALCTAISARNYDMVQILICAEADPNGVKGFSSPLVLAITLGREDIVRYLIDAGADVNGSIVRKRLQSPLKLSAIHGTSRIFWALINANASFHGTIGEEILRQVVANRWNDAVKHLLLNGTTPNRPLGSSKDGALLRAVICRADSDIIDLLVDHAADVNANNGVPLRRAAARGDLKTVQILLKAGANANASAVDAHGMNPLQGAVRSRRMDVVKVLLDAGADINAPPAPEWGVAALQAAVEEGTIGMVRLLLSLGADVNGPCSKCHGATALQKVAIRGHLPVALLLLRKGADINAAPAVQGGRTALEASAEHGRLDMMFLILRNDGDPETLETRCRRAATLAFANGHAVLARVLREWKQSESNMQSSN